MNTQETDVVIRRLVNAFPAGVVSTELAAETGRKLEQFPADVAAKAVDTYIDTSGDTFLVLTKLMVIVYRMAREGQTGLADVEKSRSRQTEIRGRQDELERLKRADALIADMNDDEVAAEWAPILQAMTGKAREWAEKWPIATIRTNRQLRSKMADLFAGAA